MSNQEDHELKGNLSRVYKIVLQSGAKGMRAVEIADKLDIDRTTVHPHLNSLRQRGLVESVQGVWSAKTREQTTKPSEKEIIIELPLPKNQWRQTAYLEAQAKKFERMGLVHVAEDMRIVLEKLKETRSIKITGKNVDNLELEKVQNLIMQAKHKSSKIDIKGFLKNLKRSYPDDFQSARHV